MMLIWKRYSKDYVSMWRRQDVSLLAFEIWTKHGLPVY